MVFVAAHREAWLTSAARMLMYAGSRLWVLATLAVLAFCVAAPKAH